MAALLMVAGASLAMPVAANGQSAATLYERGRTRDATARKSPTAAGLRAAATDNTTAFSYIH